MPESRSEDVFVELSRLQFRYFVVPISNNSRIRNGRKEHRVSDFGVVRVTEISRAGRGWISLEWAGKADCSSPENQAVSSTGPVPKSTSGGEDFVGVEPTREYQKRFEAAQNLARLDDRLFGDNASIFNGDTAFNVTDIEVPGNNGLPVKLSRRLEIELQPQGLTSYNALLGGAGNWDIDVPHIAATYPKDGGWNASRCSLGSVPPVTVNEFLRSEIWQGISVHLPGRGTTSVLGIDGSTPRPTTGG
ncbi:MAG: hypothetical protein HC794_03335 [Nitrospiraceae bacterium]|nr:hypothetical protein [Nitrospiraceae bacterium]